MPYVKSTFPFDNDRCLDREIRAPERQSTLHLAFSVGETRVTAPQDQLHK